MIKSHEAMNVYAPLLACKAACTPYTGILTPGFLHIDIWENNCSGPSQKVCLLYWPTHEACGTKSFTT